jgi:hypothetical protein
LRKGEDDGMRPYIDPNFSLKDFPSEEEAKRREDEVKRKLKGEPCPICGDIIDSIERRPTESNVYLYAVHLEKEGGKWRVRKCYLGPESQYIYVSKFHEREGLVLRGLMDFDRALEYLERLKEYFKSIQLEDSRRERLQRIIMDFPAVQGPQNIASETIRIERETLSDVMQYFIKRKTKGMTKERIERARETFLKVFSKGRKIIDVEG